MVSHHINRATLCSLAIAFYLCLLSYSTISVVSASPYLGQHSTNKQHFEREPMVPCSSVKGLHIECSPGGQKPSFNPLKIANTPQWALKKGGKSVQRRANDLLLERGLLSNDGFQGAQDRIARREAARSLY